MSQSRLEQESDGYDETYDRANSLFEGGIASGQGSDAELQLQKLVSFGGGEAHGDGGEEGGDDFEGEDQSDEGDGPGLEGEESTPGGGFQKKNRRGKRVEILVQ